MAGMLRISYKSIGKIAADKMKYKINVPKHLWGKVLNKVSSGGITNLIHQALRRGTWNLLQNGTIKITWKYGRQTIVVTGKIINKVFRIGDAWVWNGKGRP